MPTTLPPSRPMPIEPETVQLDPKYLEQALQSARMMSRIGSRPEGIHLKLQERKGHQEEIILPDPVFRALQGMLTLLAQGNALMIVPMEAELTTQQAADLLGVSRPFLIGLLNDKKIPFRKVGSHRRVLARDLNGYRTKISAERNKVLDDLAAEAQELGMGYA